MIVVPHTRLRPEVTEALDVSGYEYRTVELVGEDGYWRLLDELWQTRETFVVVEHDIVTTSEALASLIACDARWCACSYTYVKGYPLAGLGCTKFDRRLMVEHPDLLGWVAEQQDHRHPPKHWCAMDMWIQIGLMQRGARRCELHPSVTHLMADPLSSSHGCYHFEESLHG